MRGGTVLVRALIALVLMAAAVVAAPMMSVAVPAAPGVVFDDFEDGDASDWGFFGGNLAGGGGGAADDRPQAGSYYLSTGWGGEGTASAFYGGMFKNLPDTGQVALPPDPWLNLWVLNQSNATVDSYTLEVTIREDLDGNGWTDGSEDSFRLDTTFSSTAFDDQWTLVSAPVSSLANLSTGGDGTFDGKVDEVAVVVAGVVGGSGATVEVDFDQLSFTSGSPAVVDEVVFDDMDHGDPFGNGWFSFGGSVGGGGIAPNGSDLPPGAGTGFSLETGWGSGGTPGFFGGFGRTNPSDLSGTDYFNFWINPDGGQDYTIEINLQEDDDGDGAVNSADDDEFQYNCAVGPAGPCAVSGGGWQLVSLPLADFFDDNSFFTNGNGVLDPTPAASGGNGELVNVVFAIVSTGADVNFRTDDWTFTAEPPAPESGTIIDDFENGVPSGSDGNGTPIGFYTFSDGGSSVSVSTAPTPPAPVRTGAGDPNNVLQLDMDSIAFAGFIHGFENDAVDTWVTQDWSTSEGISLWFHGTGSGSDLFIDILDNRNSGSTTDDAERFTVPFVDDVAGWQLLEFPFSSFTRKDVGNGAPNDGLGLTRMHGYAIGALKTGGPRAYYLDDVALYGTAEAPAVSVQLASAKNYIEEGTTGDVAVRLNRELGPDDPAEVSISYATEPGTAVPGEDYTPTAGTLTFVNGGASELTFPVETFDNTKFTGDKRIVIRLSDPTDVELGPVFQGSVLIEDDDPYDPDLLDDFEQGAFLWDTVGPVSLDTARVTIGSADERPGQDTVERVLTASVPVSVDISVKGTLCSQGSGVVPVHLLSTPAFDATTVDHTTVTLGDARETHIDKKTGVARRHVDDVNDDGLDDLVFHFRVTETGLPCESDTIAFNGTTFDGTPITAGGSDASFGRDFAIDQDWSRSESLDFWFKGNGGGEEITVTLKDNRAPDPGPSGWSLAWSDEFDLPAGTPPDPANWSYELGDVTPDGKNGWGNDELQYYTDDPANASTDGNGNLVMTVSEADPSLECYYGPCDYESARLISLDKAEFAYGRVETRVLVPDGGAGLWPAFWSLGTDINRNPWPAAGEIDIMEYVSRLPNEIFGTIHGPGYSGGASYGGIYDFGSPTADEFHTFTVEWEPDLITWYVDGIQYHQAEPSDVAPNQWVFDKPFFLLLNFAIGGNFGGPVDPATTFPQEYAIDYVRVFQAPDSAERFEATFTDSSVGWQRVSIPMVDFNRSADQPAGAPDDGLGLDEVWGYGFATANGTAAGQIMIDEVRTTPVPPPTEVVVTNLDDSGPGSLRDALTTVAEDGNVTFDPGLAGGTLALTSGQLGIDSSVTIDASAAAPITISAGGGSRVIQVASGVTASMNDLVIRDGAAAPQGGGILNFGDLRLTRLVVTENAEVSGGAASFDLGGGGIYNGDGASLRLTDSEVSNNTTQNQPGGGIYGFFNSSVIISGSTISGNVAGDVAGGLRLLGDADISDTIISGNTSTAWHGGGLFLTDGTVVISGSSIIDNLALGGTAGGIMVATFGAPVAVSLQDSVVAGNQSYGCQVEGDPAVAVLVSLGGNTFTDGTCNPGAGDVVDPAFSP